MSTRILQKISFFSHLRKAELKRVMGIASMRKYSAGELIFSKHQTGNHLFVVKSGSVKIYTSPGLHRKKTLAYLRDGDFFGEMALLGGKIRSASAQATADSELLVIHRKNFKKLIFEDRTFTLKLLYTMSERLRKADREIESLIFQNILGRLVRTIVGLCGSRHQCPITLTLSQQELADLLGTTREPLSRALAMLKRSGMIDSRNKHIVVKNLSRLKAISN